MTLVILLFTKLDLCFAFHEILSKTACIARRVIPTVLSLALFGRIVKETFEIVAIFVEYLSSTFNMIGYPIGLHSSPIIELNRAFAMLLPVSKMPRVDGTVAIKIGPLSIFLTFLPLTVVAVSVGIEHLPRSML